MQVVACSFCGKTYKRKGIANHIKHCKNKNGSGIHAVDAVNVTHVASNVHRMSTTLPPTCEASDDSSRQVCLKHLTNIILVTLVVQCSKCDVTLKTIQALKTHEKFCRGKPTQFTGSRSLSTTLPVFNDNSCSVCGDVLPTPTGLKVHMLSHKKK